MPSPGTKGPFVTTAKTDIEILALLIILNPQIVRLNISTAPKNLQNLQMTLLLFSMEHLIPCRQHLIHWKLWHTIRLEKVNSDETKVIGMGK